MTWAQIRAKVLAEAKACPLCSRKDDDPAALLYPPCQWGRHRTVIRSED